MDVLGKAKRKKSKKNSGNS